MVRKGYDSESKFVEALNLQLIQEGFVPVRIESHSTGNGIPDLFVQGHGTDFWVECKNVKENYDGFAAVVKWRPGQQAWMKVYAQAHKGVKIGVTLSSYKNGLVIIPHYKVFECNTVPDAWFIKWEDVNRVWTKIGYFLAAIARPVKYDSLELAGLSPRIMLNKFMDKFPGYDYDPETVIPAEFIDQPAEANWFYSSLFFESILDTGIFS